LARPGHFCTASAAASGAGPSSDPVEAPARLQGNLTAQPLVAPVPPKSDPAGAGDDTLAGRGAAEVAVCVAV